ncbi:MAG TPA: hypothetical protein DEO32_02115 [Ruminococcaceae bacterium]|nr:hypothetical protein [Oscillospiraceae bacterium]
MKTSYIAQSGFEFDEASDIAIRLKIMAGEIFNAYSTFEWLKRQMFAQSAEGTFLDYIALQRGLTRREAVKAKGRITFYTEEERQHEIFIPQGTVVVTRGKNPLRFYTTEDAVIQPRTLLTVAKAEAELPGFDGNILGGVAFSPVSVPPEVSAIASSSPFIGGTDGESDEMLRERIKDSFICVPNSMNREYYIRLAESVDGVYKAGVVTYARGAGTLNIYVCGENGEVNSEVMAEVKQLVREKRAVNVDAEVYDAVPVRYNMYVEVRPKSGFSESEIKTICETAFNRYIDSVPIGGKLRLSELGQRLIDTGCITDCTFEAGVDDCTLLGTQYLVSGDVGVDVVYG